MPIISAKIIKDSISANTQTRLVTMELEYHRYIHSEFMTHRVFSRNASSSRAIPVEKLLKQVHDDPMIPVHWGSNKPGMQAGEELTNTELLEVRGLWLQAASNTAAIVDSMQKLGLHKQVANRLLEPFLSIKVVVTSTEWDNFFHLRNHKDAQPEIQELARCMKEAMDNSTPETLEFGEWHLPYVSDEEMSIMDMEDAIRASAARCARVSYLNHDKTECTLAGDIKLFNMLAIRPYDDGKGHTMDKDDPVHLSPLEHQASPIGGLTPCCTSWSGNFRNWIQFRQTI